MKYAAYLLFAAAAAALFGWFTHWLRRAGAEAWLRRAVWAAAALLLAVGLVGTDASVQRQQAETSAWLTGYARTYAREMEQLGHERIAPGCAADDVNYLLMIEAEKRWLSANALVSDVYTVRKLGDGQTVLNVDSETDYNHDGRYDETRELRTAIGEPLSGELVHRIDRALAGEEVFTPVPYTDRWGTWVTALVPLHDPRGGVDAVLGVDFAAAEWQSLARHALLAGLAILAASLLGVAAVALLWMQRHSLRVIAEQRAGMSVLEIEHATIEEIMESMDGIVWEWDVTAHRFTFISAQVEAVLGVAAEEWLAEPTLWFSHLHAEDRWADDRLDELLADTAPYALEYRMIALDGRTVWIRETGFIRRSTGEDAHQLARGCMRDISAQKAADTERAKVDAKILQAQKHEALGVMAGGIAHDFNNLLTSILGHASMALARKEDTTRLATSLCAIEEASRRAGGLCAQMLAFAGLGQFHMEPLDVGLAAEDTSRLLRASLNKKVLIECEPHPALPMVQADGTQIRQVLMNLVINAAQAIGDECGLVRILTSLVQLDRASFDALQIEDELQEGYYVCLEVRDDGPGMSAATVARIFDPFFTTKKTGHGLGLASVLGIVRSHGGALKVYSEVGAGTSFKIFLPAVEGVEPVAAAEPLCVEGWKAIGTILVADDEEILRSLYAEMLEGLGFDSVITEDGDDAVETFRRHGGDIRLVLLDLSMPRMNGAEACKAIQEMCPEVPIVLMSGFDRHDTLQKYGHLNVAGIMQKPFAMHDLEGMFQQALAGLPTPPSES